MEKLTQSFLDSCRSDDGRILRGENMSRIETFVDAAFAFAFTMLVISIDEIPDSPQELLMLSRDIPAFVLSAVVIGSIWIAHSTWSRTFGLQDKMTINLSLGLVVLVLIFVYPIKLMIQVSVNFLSGGFLGTEPVDMNALDVANLFIYFDLGLIALSLLIILLYRNSLKHATDLLLTDFELFFCRRSILTWLVVAATATVSLAYAIVARGGSVSIAGFIYTSLWVSLPTMSRFYNRKNPLLQS